jgi:hypothetical protein
LNKALFRWDLRFLFHPLGRKDAFGMNAEVHPPGIINLDYRHIAGGMTPLRREDYSG